MSAFAFILNPFTEEEDRKFQEMITRSKNAKRTLDQITPMPREGEEGEEDESMEVDASLSLSLGSNSSDQKDFEESEGSSRCDDDEEEEEEDEEGKSETSSSDSRGYQFKIKRIIPKVHKLMDELSLPAHLGKEMAEREIINTLKALPAHKIMKKTVNRTTAVITLFTLKKLSVNISVESIMSAMKKTEGKRSKSPSSSASSSFSSALTPARNDPEALGISKMVNSLEAKSPHLSQGATHLEATIEVSRKFCSQLEVPAYVAEDVSKFAALADHPALASRNPATIAASAITLAAKKHSLKLTASKIAEVSGISGCTIRKAIKALTPLTEVTGSS